MSAQAFLSGLTAYALQVALLVGVGLALSALVRMPSARVRLAYWQALLAGVLVLPLVQPRPEILASFRNEVWAGGPWPDQAAPVLAARSGASWPSLLLLALALGAACRLVWLAFGLRTLRAWSRASSAAPASLEELESLVGARARFLVSDRVSSPVTFGWRRATILLPIGFSELAPAAQKSIACHELLHVRRADWIAALFEESVRAVLWFHPAVWMLLSRLSLSREQVVDGEVVRLTGARRAYLEALRTIALQSGRAAVPGLPFFHRGHLRERVAQLCKEVSMSRSRLIALVAACASVLALTALLSVASFPLLRSAAAENQPMKVEGEVQRPQALNTPPPVYPESAKASKAEGTAILECVIDERGNVTKADVRRSSGNSDLDKAAEETVKAWTFQPATLHGKPVEVQYWLVVNFNLDESGKTK